jgi:NAD-dependent dihydropyrimidine dehydrogenase PreA subunit
MAYIITEPCVDVMDKSCVNVCPVDCIYNDEQDRSLYINPDECIDCGACEPECPVSAIFAEEEVPDKWNAFIGINKLYFSDKAAARAKLDKLYPEKRSKE